MKKIIALLILLATCIGLVGCDEESTPSDEPTPNVEQLLYEDENIKVTFIEIFETGGLSGYCYLRLKVENKSDKTVIIVPDDSYINDTEQRLLSGSPMELAPGKKSLSPFFFSYGNLGITSKDEIEKIEFKIRAVDEHYDTLFETDILVIEFNK